jgi:hypothetical protein
MSNQLCTTVGKLVEVGFHETAYISNHFSRRTTIVHSNRYYRYYHNFRLLSIVPVFRTGTPEYDLFTLNQCHLCT